MNVIQFNEKVQCNKGLKCNEYITMQLMQCNVMNTTQCNESNVM